ncbi:ankyrin [Obba rivulosa]|uniref:Ankyrin n=1 Tax=Obba rivulosa TaxID=1052685 RepID=A0A8E2DTI5_9APHY|nr:ankyrin [Obba rivulosa]
MQHSSPRLCLCLPLEIQEKLKSDAKFHLSYSFVNYPDFDDYRFKVLTQKLSPDITFVCPLMELGDSERRQIAEDRLKFKPENKRTALHYATATADVALAYECIRLGASIDCPDAEGETPLFIACQYLLHYSVFAGHMAAGNMTVPPGETIETAAGFHQNSFHNCFYIASLLVMQHADVNFKSKGGITPILFACKVNHWELMELLLKHGADIHIYDDHDLSLLFDTPAGKARFAQLVQEYDAHRPRPARLCPCWSGIPLVDCHASGTMPYPPHFRCLCSKRKEYQFCCRKRGIPMVEIWSDEFQVIGASVGMVLTIPHIDNPALTPTLQRFNEYLTTHLGSAESGQPAVPPTAFIRHIRIMADKLIAQNSLDPAFLHAATALTFIALPFERAVSKQDGKRRAQAWNNEVDIYIASAVDERADRAIEEQAKIDDYGGALYIKCSAENCSAKNLRGALLQCGKCKAVLYCSKPCQISDWTDHKKWCKIAMQSPAGQFVKVCLVHANHAERSE